MLQLDDDLRVEMKIVSHVREIDVLQGMQVVRPVTAVKLGEVHSQRTIFERRQDSIPGILVKRHASFQRPAICSHHAASENRIRFAGNDRMIKMRQDLRGVLAISVEQHHGVETFIDEIPVAGFLISAVP